jgi:hypothetical protein
VAAIGYGEPVILREIGELLVAVGRKSGGMLLVVDVGDPLQEDERKDVLLVVASVDEAPSERSPRPTGRTPAPVG